MSSYHAIGSHIKRLADEAHRGCGLCYELFAIRFSDAVDCAFPPSNPNREAALAIALESGVYLTVDERNQERADWAAQGLCSHGLDPKWCPMGCGDLDEHAGGFEDDDPS